jgi:hypothetical protein
MVCGFGGRGALETLDVTLGVAVDDPQSLRGGMLSHELAVLASERFAKADWGMATEVRKSLPFLFAHVVVVGRPGAADGRPPLFGAGSGRVGVAHPVANVVVVTDGIERLAFGIVGASLQQLWVENLFFDVGVHVELVAERTPYPLERGAVDRCLRLQIVQLGELFAEPVTVSTDQTVMSAIRTPSLSDRNARGHPVHAGAAQPFRRLSATSAVMVEVSSPT